jgi:TRAP-type C4-dicarboxylate transport system substrate-binding protein
MRSRTVGRLAGALLVAVVAPGLTGCARQVAGPGLVLRLATPDRQVDATGPQVAHFAEEVARRSGGTIRIDPVWDVTPNGAHNWDQTVARGVAHGTWDMGLVPGRAWDVLGVDSLRALNTPFLITSGAALQAVLDSGLRGDLLAGLPEAGVTGLDLFPDQLRHPFGYDRALLGADDYTGQSIRAPTSDTVSEVFAALGATTTDDDPDSVRQRGDESSYSLAQGHIATGNVTLYPKTDTLVVRTAVRDRLRNDQWSLLHEAAAATRDWLFARDPSDQAAAAAFCNQGGAIVTATAAQLSGLKQAVAPLVARLRRNPSTGRLIDAIGDLVDGLPAEPSLTSCPRRVPSADDAQLQALNGTYVTTVTEKQLRDAGEHDPQQLRENSGHITWVLDGGRWTYHQVASHYIARPDDSGRYTYRDGLFTFYWDAGPGDWTKARLQVARGGSIRFRDVVDGHPENQTVSEGYFREWTRVGGLPR